MIIRLFVRPSFTVFSLFLSAGCALIVVPVCLSQGTAAALTGSATYMPSMTFEIASVRESNPDPIKGFMVGGGFNGRTSSLRLSNERIGDIVAIAYGLSTHEIEGLPGWTGGPMYNVQAKSDDVTDEKMARLSEEEVKLEQQHMLQTLLAERFNLKMHWSVKERPNYNLVAARGGTKLHSGGSLPPSDDELKRFGCRKPPEVSQSGDGTRGYEFIGHDCHIASLAKVLGSLMSTDVIDKTGLTGTYDFDLRYSQASDAQREKDPSIFPPIPDAVEDQLGLKLERAKGSVRELIVDHIDSHLRTDLASGKSDWAALPTSIGCTNRSLARSRRGSVSMWPNLTSEFRAALVPSAA